MGYVSVFVTNSDGDQDEVDRIVYVDGRVFAEHSSKPGRLIIGSEILEDGTGKPLTVRDGERFMEDLHCNFSGSRLRCSKYKR